MAVLAAVVLVVGVIGVALWWVTRDKTQQAQPGQAPAQQVTKCGTPPQFQPVATRTDPDGLVLKVKVVAQCQGGDVLAAPQTRVTVTSDNQNIASGTFDLSKAPVVVPSGGNNPSIEHEFRFPVGTFWRLPVSTEGKTGPVDLDPKTFVVDYSETGSTTSTAQFDPAKPSTPSAAAGPAPPKTGDDESASLDALKALANADRPFVTSQLADKWEAQLSSKRLGLVAEGKTWNNAEILREHLQLRLKYPEARLLYSGDWSTFSAPDFWITVAGVTFPDSAGALNWCTTNGFDRDHCYAKLVSTTHPVDGSTAFNK